MVGHYAHIPNFWVAVSVALMIFSITSGFLTYLRYSNDYSFAIFWKKKLDRLLPHLLSIYAFLFVLFIFKNQKGLYSWHTLINLFGMNGFLNWFHINNKSPYGAGMWFLTLLLIFYFTFPIFRLIYLKLKLDALLTGIFILSFYFLHLQFRYGHALWLTACGFPIGIYLAKHNFNFKAKYILFILLFCFILMLILHFFLQIDLLNFFFILLLSTFLVLFTQKASLNSFFMIPGRFLASMLLEIYLLHPYLKVQIVNSFIDILISIILTIFISYMLLKLQIILKKYATYYVQ